VRSDGLARLSKYIRSKGAHDSESSPILGSDPLHYASMAANDAKVALELQPGSAEARLQLGTARYLLEEYDKALSEFKAGLAIYPEHKRLQEGLREVEEVLAGSPFGSAAKAGTKRAASGEGREVTWDDDLECTLCMEMLFEPVTSPCGHTFCQDCFARAMDHHNRCPMCRVVLHVGRKLPVTVALRSILLRNFPEQYEARRSEMEKSQRIEDDGPVPLFVMSLVLPGERIALNIFEPRYRLMIRRCMDGNRIFAMGEAVPAGVRPEACQVEIIECQSLPDGRYGIEVVGKRRLRISRTWDQDGYRVAQPEYFGDVPVEPGTPAAEELTALATSVSALADAFIGKVRSHAHRNRQVLQFLSRAGDKPEDASNPEALSFWASSLCMFDPSERLRLLRTTDTAERLRCAEAALRALTEQELSACSIM